MTLVTDAVIVVIDDSPIITELWQMLPTEESVVGYESPKSFIAAAVANEQLWQEPVAFVLDYFFDDAMAATGNDAVADREADMDGLDMAKVLRDHCYAGLIYLATDAHLDQKLLTKSQVKPLPKDPRAAYAIVSQHLKGSS